MVVVTLKGNENEGEVKEKRRGIDEYNRDLMMMPRGIDMAMMTLR